VFLNISAVVNATVSVVVF